MIAAVNGYAMDGGMEICLACDMVVADEAAQSALSEVKVGVVAAAGGAIRLPRQIPRKIASELLLTGRRIDPAQAEQFGFVNRIVPAGKALDGARSLAAEPLQALPTSVRLTMRLMNDSERVPSAADAALRPAGVIDDLLASEDFFEGPAAFAQKRKPVWKNR